MMRITSGTLEDIATLALPIGQTVTIASNVMKMDFPGKIYVGDFAHVALYSYFVDYVSRRIEEFGRLSKNKVIQKIGEYCSEITIPLVTTYFVLGETVIDWIPFNVMDEKDVYAAVVAGSLGVLHARGMKRRRMSEEYSGTFLKEISDLEKTG